jgi:hypothetical protein
MDTQCRNCRYFDRATVDSESGYCKRRAPQAGLHVHHMMLKLLADLHYKTFDGDTALSEGMSIEGTDPSYAEWPYVDDIDGCGEFEAMANSSPVGMDWTLSAETVATIEEIDRYRWPK